MQRLEEVELELSDPDIWSDQDNAQALSRDRSALEKVITVLDELSVAASDASELAELASDEGDGDALDQIDGDLDALEAKLAELEFRRMFDNEMDESNAFVEIQSGSGGTEAQDWAEMLLRMYLRWGEKHGFATEIAELSPGDVAGIKGATVQFNPGGRYGVVMHLIVRVRDVHTGPPSPRRVASVSTRPAHPTPIDAS